MKLSELFEANPAKISGDSEKELYKLELEEKKYVRLIAQWRSRNDFKPMPKTNYLAKSLVDVRTRIKELGKLTEAKAKHLFQFKIKSDFMDIDLGVKTLEDIADEIRSHSHQKDMFIALPKIHSLLVEYHCGPGDVDVVDEGYDIHSFQDDVLKVDYQFTERFKNPKEPRTIKGQFTVMEESSDKFK